MRYRYPNLEFVQQVVAQISRSHNNIIEEIPTTDKRRWYIEKIIENGWSRNILIYQIESNLYQRQIRECQYWKD